MNISSLNGFNIVIIIFNGITNGVVYHNSIYNEAITPALRQSIQRDLPKEAKFFDDFDHFNQSSHTIVIIENKNDCYVQFKRPHEAVIEMEFYLTKFDFLLSGMFLFLCVFNLNTTSSSQRNERSLQPLCLYYKLSVSI
uniref:Uncharacterized protein n=1 Tax=Glossina austeni TaxID=7395 RepID=A0A1A9UK25_GLOAU